MVKQNKDIPTLHEEVNPLVHLSLPSLFTELIKTCMKLNFMQCAVFTQCMSRAFISKKQNYANKLRLLLSGLHII